MSDLRIDELVRDGDTAPLVAWLRDSTVLEIVDELTRLDPEDTAVAFRLLPRDRALDVFEALEPVDQQQVLDGLRADRVRSLIEALDPDDRARLFDEMPAKVVNRLLAQLSPDERALTTVLLGYPEQSAGRLMSPEFVSLRASMTAAEAIDKIRHEGLDAETVYALPVLDDHRHLIGILGLRALVLAPPSARVGELMTTDIHQVTTDVDQEVAARLVREAGLIALPVVDSEARLVGVITVDDALRVLEDEETEDFALAGGASPLRTTYLAASALGVARVRALWLLLLIVAAALTVNVLQIFESTLDEVVTLALFIPLVTGTGGNSGAQASTAVIRAMAIGEVRLGDLPRIVWREARVGLLLGLMLSAAAAVPVSLLYGGDIGLVIMFTLILVCTWATTAGSALPLFARRAGVDPAVVSAPLITTLVDASGLVIYFVVAKLVLSL
ncbi:magnesium transporter [Actinomarinicola tropica]|uniref:Magnesium transporter MgtE n=1 Tax=Actinomarinicola tropica TaxID=2789776 RepID=A0A5Q2RQB0_9ACTN|nr:magnesium transporter [Actinomarinicola tropica]QGG96751.1 magnesium transporter [Actinomarinicola tropica]